MHGQNLTVISHINTTTKDTICVLIQMNFAEPKPETSRSKNMSNVLLISLKAIYILSAATASHQTRAHHFCVSFFASSCHLSISFRMASVLCSTEGCVALVQSLNAAPVRVLLSALSSGWISCKLATELWK